MRDPETPPNGDGGVTWRDRISGSKLARVFAYHDFRLLWIGAFVSFTGSWVQRVAEGYFVYAMTRDESKLAFVSFCNSAPVLFFGFLGGWLADTMNKRAVLVVTQSIYALGAIYLAVATYYKFVQYWQIVAVALVLGLVSCVEMPCRQSIVSRVVPPEQLSAAVPVNAMTFNIARILGPAIGGAILAKYGVPACYMVNGLSFIAIIWAALAIRSNLAVMPHHPQPVIDLIMDGARYTWREARLRTLLILESITAVFGLVYIPLIPAYVDQALGMGTVSGLESKEAKSAISHSYTAMGIGAFVGLLIIISLSDSPHKRQILRIAMAIIGAGLVGLGFTHSERVAYVLLAFAGGCTIVQFNSTNALFQILSPDRLRGRVLSMHIWALNGLSPFGVLLAGWLAMRTRVAAGPLGDASVLPTSGVRLAIFLGGLFVLAGAFIAMFGAGALSGLNDGPSRE